MTFPPRPAHKTIGCRQDRRPVVSKRPLHILAAAKMSPHIHIGPEPVLAAHARSPPATVSLCPAGADSAPHSEQNFHGHQMMPCQKTCRTLGWCTLVGSLLSLIRSLSTLIRFLLSGWGGRLVRQFSLVYFSQCPSIPTPLLRAWCCSSSLASRRIGFSYISYWL